MVTPDGDRLLFALSAARELLPTVKRLTAEAVTATDAIVAELRQVPEDHPRHDSLRRELAQIVQRWAARIRGLDAEAKGLWLVDFDNGEGYYCWCYPEETISHFHGYDDGFKGRMKIV